MQLTNNEIDLLILVLDACPMCVDQCEALKKKLEALEPTQLNLYKVKLVRDSRPGRSIYVAATDVKSVLTRWSQHAVYRNYDVLSVRFVRSVLMAD